MDSVLSSSHAPGPPANVAEVSTRQRPASGSNPAQQLPHPALTIERLLASKSAPSTPRNPAKALQDLNDVVWIANTYLNQDQKRTFAAGLPEGEMKTAIRTRLSV